ncbi:STAS domain-containing protein [Streptomyces sp. NPDC101733]|uniref:STAS domain-containing protein n=1 Tax=unclassified Streptomyces TaxID=2593676 RepID=UPI0037FF00AF
MTDQNNNGSHKTRTITEPGRIRVLGALDQDSAADGYIQAWLSQQTTRPDSSIEIVVDLEGCTFCDSTGLNVLVQARADAITRGHTIRLHAPQPQLIQFLRRTGTTDLFTITPTPPAA